MSRLVAWARRIALTFGAPGLMVVAALDSSFLPLPGVTDFPVARFALAIAIGRSARYLALGALTVRYGARAQTYLAERGVAVSIVVVGVLSAAFALYLVWTRAKARKSR